jgi:hypothetical protein
VSAFLFGFLISISVVALVTAGIFSLARLEPGPPTLTHFLGMIAGLAVGLAFVLLPVMNWLAKQAQP